ncbi:MAG: hypothetical protein M3350_09175 [Actinomycetota bacterium]|nr:hypothetical protein [Actinomycetota bacterium]MDQ3720932.1 hypothetical protein [Actinomycetota bacterium]
MDKPQSTLRELRWIRVAAFADFALLVPLVAVGLSHQEGVVGILGPSHGVGFLLLLFSGTQSRRGRGR